MPLKTTPEQRTAMRHRASQEGVAIGGYHVLRLLDDVATLLGALEYATRNFSTDGPPIGWGVDPFVWRRKVLELRALLTSDDAADVCTCSECDRLCPACAALLTPEEPDGA